MKAIPLLAVCGLLVALEACGGSTLEIRPMDSLDDPDALAGLLVVVEGKAFEADQLRSRRVIAVPSSGHLDMHVELRRDGRVIAQGDVGWALQKNWDYTLLVFRSVTDPTRTCFGCGQPFRFLLDAAASTQEGDALWVVGAGGPRDGSIVY
jgi:hypothetical protein